jgi:uncharacterized protein YcbK (DUF882 family)
MNIEKFIIEELKKLKLEQKLETAFKDDPEIQRIILNEVDPSQDSKSMGMYPTPGEAWDATVAPAGNWIWKQLEKTVEPDVKYSTVGARIVWAAFMKLPSVGAPIAGSAALRPIVDPEFDQKERKIVLKTRKFIKDEFCKDNFIEINKKLVASILENLQENLQEEFPDLKDEYFRKANSEFLDIVWKIIRVGVKGTFKNKEGFKKWKPSENKIEPQKVKKATSKSYNPGNASDGSINTLRTAPVGYGLEEGVALLTEYPTMVGSSTDIDMADTTTGKDWTGGGYDPQNPPKEISQVFDRELKIFRARDGRNCGEGYKTIEAYQVAHKTEEGLRAKQWYLKEMGLVVGMCLPKDSPQWKNWRQYYTRVDKDPKFRSLADKIWGRGGSVHTLMKAVGQSTNLGGMAPEPGTDAGCAKELDSTFSDDLIKHLMICILDIPFSNEGVSRGDISKFPNLMTMIDYYSSEFLVNINASLAAASKGSEEQKKIAVRELAKATQFQNWARQRIEKDEEEAKSTFRKSLEILGDILLYALPFQMGKGLTLARAAATRARLTKASQILIAKGLMKIEAMEIALLIGMWVHNLWTETEIQAKEMDREFQNILKVLRADGKKTSINFKNFKKDLKEDETLIKKRVENSFKVIDAAATAIMTVYSKNTQQGSGEINRKNLKVELTPETKRVQADMRDLFNKACSDSTARPALFYKKLCRQLESTMLFYRNLNKKIKKGLKIKIDKNNLNIRQRQKRNPTTTTTYGQDGSTQIKSTKTGEVLRTNAPSPKAMMMNQLEEQKKKTTTKIPGAPHFSYEEFKCKDKNNTPVPEKYKKNVRALAIELEKIRNKTGALGISSGYRTPDYNTSINGATTSQHMLGRAADIKPAKGNTKTIPQIYKIVNDMMASGEITAGGLGYYDGWVHYDIRGSRVAWGDKGKIATALGAEAKVTSGANTEGDESDTAKIIKSWSLGSNTQTPTGSAPPQRGATSKTACHGAKNIKNGYDLRNTLALILKGGEYCKYGLGEDDRAGRKTFSTAYSYLSNAQYIGKASEQAIRDQIRISNNIKNIFWRNMEDHLAGGAPGEVKKFKWNLDNSFSDIYGLNFGAFDLDRGDPDRKSPGVYNIGFLHVSKREKRAFCFESGIETWSRADAFLWAMKGGKSVADLDIISPEKLEFKRILNTLKDYHRRAVAFRGFMVMEQRKKERYVFNKDPKLLQEVLKLCNNFILACRLLSQAIRGFQSNPSNETLLAIMRPGETISRLSREVEDDL